jgi:hypothetical protein
MFRIARNGDNLTQGLFPIRQSADRKTDGTPPPHTMLTISITFAILVALWGFSGTIAAHAKRALTQATPKLRTRPVASPRPATVRASASRTRGTRPVASA